LVEVVSGCDVEGERKANLRIRKMLSFSTVVDYSTPVGAGLRG